ncbi:MAG: hypothetical protein ACYTDT_02925 [Planctomycetota bacterium]|jgi:hypothetical protein
MTEGKTHPFLEPLLGDFSSIAGDTSTAIKAIRRAVEADAPMRLVKLRPDHAVIEVSEFAVKAFRRSVMDRVSVSKFSPAAKEWELANEALNREIPIANPVGVIATSEFSYFVSERVPEFVLLQELIPVIMGSRRSVKSWVAEFSAFTARLHMAGLVQSSHPLKSIFAERAKHPEFIVGDLSGEEFLNTADLDTRLEHLAYLSLCFPDISPLMQRRFFRQYFLRMSEADSERKTVRKVLNRSISLQFELNSARISGCTTPSSVIATAQRDGVQLALFRQTKGIELSDLERPVSKASGVEWEQLLRSHFSQRLGNERVWNIKCPVKHGGHSVVKRRVEATWGRLLELNALHVNAPMPMAVIIEPDLVRVFGSVPGQLKSLSKKRSHDDLELFEQLSSQLIRMHRYGVFFLPIDADELIKGLHYSQTPEGERRVVLTAPDHMFRGKPTTLGQQAVASLGRIGHTVMNHVGERQMKELVWAYARQLRLNQHDTDMLLSEARRNPTGQTLVMTQGLERSHEGA